MTALDIPHLRLRNQQLSSASFKKAGDLVTWFGAVQAQDYSGAKWALGQRMTNATDNTIEEAFTRGEILRTHIMRPTWHFVAPADIRWLLSLTASRIKAASSYQCRKLELDDAVFLRSNKALAKALRDGKHLTRDALRTVVERAGIVCDDLQRFNFILFRAEVAGLICSGPRNGKQFTYALLDERAPAGNTLTREEALAELTLRYFTSHGPATAADFAWWSGLAPTDVRKGLEMVTAHFAKEVIDGKTYWLPTSMPAVKRILRVAYLLPPFDEYLVAYKDRSAVTDPGVNQESISDNFLFQPTIVWDGRIVGTWMRKIEKAAVILTVHSLAPFNETEKKGVGKAVRRYGEFLKLPAMLQ
ncbi:MAG TPA: winged helix DNA-binding domain-containing protein [Pyrinomonadaceae bacterium]|jgi:hypothetical protein